MWIKSWNQLKPTVKANYFGSRPVRKGTHTPYHKHKPASWPPWKDLGLECRLQISKQFQQFQQFQTTNFQNRINLPTSRDQTLVTLPAVTLLCEAALLPKVETRCCGKAHIGVEVQHQSPCSSNMFRIVGKLCACGHPPPRYRGRSQLKRTRFVLECKKRTQQRFYQYVHFQQATNHSKHATALQNPIFDDIPNNDSTMKVSSIQQLHRFWQSNWMLIH